MSSIEKSPMVSGRPEEEILVDTWDDDLVNGIYSLGMDFPDLPLSSDADVFKSLPVVFNESTSEHLLHQSLNSAASSSMTMNTDDTPFQRDTIEPSALQDHTYNIEENAIISNSSDNETDVIMANNDDSVLTGQDNVDVSTVDTRQGIDGQKDDKNKEECRESEGDRSNYELINASSEDYDKEDDSSMGKDCSASCDGGTDSEDAVKKAKPLVTSVPTITVTALPDHWRCNKSLPVPLTLISSADIEDGTEVEVSTRIQDTTGELKNNTASFLNNQAKFNDFRFVSRSGRGHAFTITFHIKTDPSFLAELAQKVKITVDGPRPPRLRRSLDSFKSNSCSDAESRGRLSDYYGNPYAITHSTGGFTRRGRSPVFNSKMGLLGQQQLPVRRYYSNLDNGRNRVRRHRSYSNTRIQTQQFYGSSTPTQDHGNNQFEHASTSVVPKNLNDIDAMSFAFDHQTRSTPMNDYGQQVLAVHSQNQPLIREYVPDISRRVVVDGMPVMQGYKLLNIIPSEGTEGQTVLAELHVHKSLVKRFGWSNMRFCLAFGNTTPQFINVDVTTSGTLYCHFRVPAMQSTVIQAAALVKIEGKVYSSDSLLVFKNNSPTASSQLESYSPQALGKIMLELHREILGHRDPMLRKTEVEFTNLLYNIERLESQMLELSRRCLAHLGSMKFLPNIDNAECAGITILHLCGEFGWEKFIHLLLQAGADIHQRDAEGQTVIDWAYRNGRHSTVHYLKMRGAHFAHLLQFRHYNASETMPSHNFQDHPVKTPGVGGFLVEIMKNFRK
eukprot:CFRG3640T1